MNQSTKDYSILQEKFGLPLCKLKGALSYYPSDSLWIKADFVLAAVSLFDQAYSESELSKTIEALCEQLKQTSKEEEVIKVTKLLEAVQITKLLIKQKVWKKEDESWSAGIMEALKGKDK